MTIERRRNARFHVNEPVEVCELKNEVCIRGRIQDISRNGVGIAVPLPVFSGEPVELRSKRLRVLAEVRHCRQTGDGYLLGLEFCHEILNSEIQSVRTQQTINPEPPESYLEKLPPPSRTMREGKR